MIRNLSALAKAIGEATSMAELYARLQLDDWQPLKFWANLGEEMKRTRRPLRRNDLIRLAALCMVGAWIRDMGD